MAIKKKAKAKAKTKKAKKKVGAKKRVKAKTKKLKAASKIVRAMAVAVKSAAPSTPPAGPRIGIVTHYFTHLSVAIVLLESGGLREGDMVHIKGHTSDFKQRVESMELDRVHVSAARTGQSVGLKVIDHAREHDVVYRVGTPQE